MYMRVTTVTNLPIPAYGSSVLVLPASVLTLTPPDSAYLRVLFALCAQNRAEESVEALAKALSLPSDTVKNAIAYWVEHGALTYAEGAPIKAPQKDEKEPQNEPTPKAKKALREALPKYSEEELAEIYQNNESLRPTLEACQNELGKIFSAHEAAKMAALYDYYGLDEAYLITLCAMCKKRGKESVSYVVKTALGLYDDNIRTSKELDAYVKQQDLWHNSEMKLRKLFGFIDRALTTSERTAFEAWTLTWCFPFEIIEAAYEIAVHRTGKASVPYVNKILSSWNENGIRTLEAVEAAQAEFAKNQKVTTATKEKGEAHSYELDEFVDLALKRSF